MSARTGTDSHHRAAVTWAAGRVVAFSFSVVMALSGPWALSAASASPDSRGESDVRPSRGPKPTERSCSTGESPERDTEDPPSGGGRLGYRHRSAAPVRPAAGSGDGCPDDEPRGAASSDDQGADGRRANAGPSGSPEARDPSSGERRAPASPASGRPAASTPAPGSGAGPGADPDGPHGRSQPSDNDASGVDDHGSDGSGASGGRSPGTGSEQDRASPKSPSEGAGNAFSGGGGRGTGGGDRRPGGSACAGRGGNHSAPSADIGRAPSGGGDGLPGFRTAPANRARLGGIGSGSVRVPGLALLSSPGIPSTVALPSAAAAALAAPGRAAVAATPIARTGGEISASTVLALLLLLVGGALRRTARVGARTPA